MEITDRFELSACNNRKKFDINHKEIPIKLSPDLDEAIKYLLWYVPNINSEQAKENDLLKNKEYDDYIFEEIMSFMNLSDRDVLFTDDIATYIVDDFRGEVCTDDQKIVMSLADGETKTMSLLRHIRNAIAHGNFNVIDKLVIGFDFKRLGDDKVEYRAVFKIRPDGLLKALRKINFDFTSQEFIGLAFKNCGYFVEEYQEKYQKSHRFDLFAKKNDKRFALEIRNYDYGRKIYNDEVSKIIKAFEGSGKGIIPILIINSSYLTEESKEDLLRADFIILDIKNIKKMYKGRDMVSEILRDNAFLNKYN